jgi:hypothetical protein
MLLGWGFAALTYEFLLFIFPFIFDHAHQFASNAHARSHEATFHMMLTLP